MDEKAKDKKKKRSIKQRVFYNKIGERTLLGKFCLDKEGDLKEVPVGITTVLVIIILISLAVQVKEPAKETVVKVTHLFKAAPPPESTKAKAEEEKITDQKKSEEKKAQTAKKVVDVEKKEKAEKDLKTIKEEIAQTKKEAAQMKQEAEKTLADAKRIKEEAEKLKAELKKPLSAKVEEIKTLKDKLAGKEDSLKGAERKNLEQKAKLKEAEEKLQKSEMKFKDIEEEKKALKNTTQLAKVEEEKEKAIDVKDKSEIVRDEADKFNKSADDVKEKSKEVKSHLKAMAEDSKWPGDKEKMASLRIADEEYTRIYRERFQSGKKEPETRYRWRVSNRYRLKLKDCYTLFDMKAVAVTKNGRYYDLSDNSQLTEEYLNKNYSSTVILCENPEVDFGGDIKKLGLGAKDLTVRYYMYNHTRNYFYNRVEQAVKCSLQQGKINREKNWQERIDVVGNVYKIKKASGGFGIFVPTSVYYRNSSSSDAKEIRISPSCFENEEDVKILRAKKLL